MRNLTLVLLMAATFGLGSCAHHGRCCGGKSESCCKSKDGKKHDCEKCEMKKDDAVKAEEAAPAKTTK